MGLLQQDGAQLDDAAKGESFTKGTSHVVVAAVIATILVSVAIAAYVIVEQKPPAMTGEILSVTVHPMHVETSGIDASGAAVPKEAFDQVYVFTQVRLHNQSQGPMFLQNMLTNATLPDGIHSSYAAPASEYDRVFLAYPGIPVAHNKALPLDTTIEPGETVEGSLVSAFKLTKEQWDAHKDLNFTFAFRYQPNLVLTPQGAVTEQ
jgi:hypothetical protein